MYCYGRRRLLSPEEHEASPCELHGRSGEPDSGHHRQQIRLLPGRH